MGAQMKRLVVVAALVFGGCSTLDYVFSVPPKEFVTPDGRQGYIVACPSGMSECYQAARAACSGGNYEVLRQAERPTYKPPNQYTGAAATTGVDRSLELVCDKRD